MDGWNEEKICDLLSVTDEIYDAVYELKNCVRGCHTGCKTYAELGEYMKELAERLHNEADYVCNLPDDPEDEDSSDDE